MGRISAREVAETTENAVRLFTWQIKYEPGQCKQRIKDALFIVGKPRFIQKFPDTVVEVIAVYGGRVYRQVEIIKLYSKDKWDTEIGQEIALAKALSSIAGYVFETERKQRLDNNKNGR